MSSSAAENYFVFGTLTLASLASPGTTESVYISNRPYEAGGNVYRPLINTINGISYGMGAYTPKSSSGSITLDDSPHSFGFERRLSDLLERYSILDQDIEIGVRIGTDLDDHLGTSGTTATIFRGQILDWKKDVRAQTLTLRVKGEDLSRNVITRSVNSTDFPSAPESSLGKHLPLVFGNNIEVKPVLESAPGSTSPSFAYMTALTSAFPSGGVQKYYAKDRTGTFRQVASAASLTAGVYAVTETAPIVSLFGGFFEWANKITLGNGGIITNARVRCTGSGSAAWNGGDGTIQLNLYEVDERGYPGKLIAQATRAKIDYQTNFRGAVATRFWVEFTFEEPVVLGVGSATSFFISIADVTADNYTTDTGIYLAASNPAVDVYRWDYSGNASNKVWKKTASVNGYQITFDLFGVQFTDTTSYATNSSGFSYARIGLTQYTITGSYASSPSLTELDLVLTVNGLKDVNGWITTAGAVITRPDHAIRLLTNYYSGSSWNNSTVDASKFSDSTTGVSTSTDRYYREIGGRSDGRGVVADLVADIAKSCAVRVAHCISSTASKRFAVFCWSTNRPTAATLTNRNSNILEIEQRDAATVVNRASVYCNESLRGLSVEAGSSEDRLKNYSYVGETYNGIDSMGTALTSESFSIYGERPNAAVGYKWLNAKPRFASDYLCALFAKPHTYVTVSVPFGDFYALEVLEVVEILHPELFAYFGTSADPGSSTYAGTAVDPATGQYIVRARTYRGQIEGKEIVFSPNEAPTIRLTCRLLTNYPNDPT